MRGPGPITYIVRWFLQDLSVDLHDRGDLATSNLFSGPDPYSQRGLHYPYEFTGCLNIMLKILMNLNSFWTRCSESL